MRYAMVITACLVLLSASLSLFGPSAVGYEELNNDTRAQNFTNVSIQAGLSGYRGDNLAWGDYNNDGWLDLLVRGPSSNYLFRNEGDGTFTEVSNSTGVNVTRGYSQWADYNADGYLDFYTAGNDDHLFRGNGPPNWDFTDVTSQAGDPSDGVQSEGIAWVDYDRDGYPDIFTVGWRKPGDLQWPYAGEPDKLYHNNGDGTFSDVSLSAGLRPRSTSYAGMGVVMCDPNEDGWPDIYVSNYHLNPNQLWINNRDGTFTDMAFEYNLTGKATDYEGSTYYGHSNGAGWADYDNDQDMDVWVSHLAHKDDERSGMNRGYYCADSQLFENTGIPDIHFEDRRVDAGIPITPSGTLVQDPDSGDYMWKDEDYFGVAWGDCDNDGDLDLWVPQVKTYSFWDHSFLWENGGDKTFSDSTDASGLKVWSNTGGTWVDYDNDGDLDFCTEGTYPFRGPRDLHLFENPGTSGHWLELDLKGAGGNQQTSMDAAGTKVVLKCGDDVYTRYVGGDCGGHGFQQPPRLHFGLGSNTEIDEMWIHWTSGRIQRFADVSADQLLTIDEPTTQFLEIDTANYEYTILEDEALSIEVDIDGPTLTGIYWDLDNDRDFETETLTEDLQTSFSEEGTRWIKLRMKDRYSHFWELEPIIVDVQNKAPKISAPLELVLLEEEVYLLDLSPVDTASDLPNLTFEWDFGDGAWVEGSSAEEISFTDAGEYIVQARVTDDNGETDEKSVSVEVFNQVPWVKILGEDYVIEGGSIEFEAHAQDSAKDMEAMMYRFHSGDGQHSSWIRQDLYSFVYNENGTYTASAEVMDRHEEISVSTLQIIVSNEIPIIIPEVDIKEALEDQEISFNAELWDTENDMEDLEVRWNFADGSSWSSWSSDPGIKHTFEDQGDYKVQVQAIDDDSMIGGAEIQVNVSNVLPSADIFIGSSTIFEDRMVSFTATLSDSASDIDDLEHMWSVDGDDMMWMSGDPVLDHVFTTSGDHIVSLHVKDDDIEMVYNTTVTVQNLAPEADLRVSMRSVYEDEQVTFDASDSTDTASDESSLSFHWSLDGTYWEIGSEIMKRTFTGSGSYEVHLKVVDDDGAFTTEKITITVNNKMPEPYLDIPSTSDEDEVVIFDASGTLDTVSDMDKLVYTFDPGDGSDPIVSNDPVVNHTYTEPGEYTVSLSVSDGDDSVIVTEKITILKIPKEESSGSNAFLILIIIGVLAILIAAALLGAVLVLRGRAQIPPQAGEMPPQMMQGMYQGQLPVQRRPSLPPPAPKDPNTAGYEQGRR